jgi:hypothetical protein
MQKIVTIVLLFVYLTLSVGLNILVHTCGGESEAILATARVEDPCGCDDDMSADKCCTTEITTIQLSNEQKASVTTIDQQLVVCGEAPVCTVVVDHSDGSEFSSVFLSSFSPPPAYDRCIVNSVFLI